MKNRCPEQTSKSTSQRLILRSVLGVGGSISTQSLCKHLVFDVSWPRKPLQITMADMDLSILQETYNNNF